ncbi:MULTISPECIES: hypothetical protein [unclassified Moritella]|uniref:hypothetical protein n=1 Tax=unclassified Moritella TaxID=2637987 RepID=UPI001BA8DFA6|nr:MULTISPECIES: hypothetical protein [unclassified Moritella]QUM84921.1 hypothetical protein HWV02_10655 [Moritella sp. 28]QUM89153.1 hypothetical protein HWV03_10260 [Moritella sp. 36]
MSSLETNRLLQDKILNDDSHACAVKQLSNLGISGLMTLEAIEFQILELDAVLVSCQQLQDSYSPLITSLPSRLHICFQGSATSREQLAALVKIIESAPQALWSLRDDSFNCYEMDFRLAELQQLLAILKPLNKKLAPFVNTHKLGSASTLRNLQCCLDNAGMFCWFSSKWRNAKQQALILATNEQLKLDDIKLLFPAMIKYANTQAHFDELFEQAPILATYHKGLNTDVVPLLAVREWYKDVEFAMAEHFVGEAGILEGLSIIDKQKADKLVKIYHASSVLVINSIDKQMSKLRLSFPGYEALQHVDADYVAAVSELKAIIVNQLSVLNDAGVDSRSCLSEL